ncbi:MAG: hypothetical protein HY898_19050 [Deltaproteobacteria bacterium]|nr:hypothetical protein [Deltaproteobacteria bacterium]
MRLLSVLLCLALPACGARTPLAEEETGHDAGPILDAQTDASSDASKSDCTDPSITYVYVVTESARVYSFKPATGIFALIGALDCPAHAGETPFSMGVDRKGNAYVVYSNGDLFRASTATGHCKATGFQPGAQGFIRFGMGFSTDQGGPSEKLYLAASETYGSPYPPALGWLDTATYEPHAIAYIADTGMELTGTGDGRLYGFFDNGVAAHLVQLDKKTGQYLTDTTLPGVSKGSAWAFAFWGGDFWFFTAPAGTSTVTRYQPSSKKIEVVGILPSEQIVGAGVSTCAPEQ